MFNLTEKLIISDQVLLQEMDGETVLLNLENGHYYSLNPVGSDFWKQITEDNSLSRCIKLLMSKYDVEQDQLETDLQALIQQLKTAGILLPETR